MITAKTNDGFEIELSEDALDDAELLDALGGMQDGNVFDMTFYLSSDEQTRR